MRAQVVSVKRPRSGLFAAARSLPDWLRALWRGAGRTALEEGFVDGAAADDAGPSSDASLVPIPRWPRLRAGRTAGFECGGCAVCVAVCPSRALEAVDRGLPVLDLGRCIGCGLCVDRCPAAALELGDGMPVLFAPRGNDGIRIALGERSLQ